MPLSAVLRLSPLLVSPLIASTSRIDLTRPSTIAACPACLGSASEGPLLSLALRIPLTTVSAAFSIRGAYCQAKHKDRSMNRSTLLFNILPRRL